MFLLCIFWSKSILMKDHRNFEENVLILANFSKNMINNKIKPYDHEHDQIKIIQFDFDLIWSIKYRIKRNTDVHSCTSLMLLHLAFGQMYLMRYFISGQRPDVPNEIHNIGTYIPGVPPYLRYPAFLHLCYCWFIIWIIWRLQLMISGCRAWIRIL